MTNSKYAIKIGAVVAAAIGCAVALMGLLGSSADARNDALMLERAERGLSSVEAATPITSILDLHTDHFLSQAVVVTGYYMVEDRRYLALDYEDFEANRPLPPHSYLRLRGSLPAADHRRAMLVVTGTLGRYEHDYAYWGVEEGRVITVSDWLSVGTPPPTLEAPARAERRQSWKRAIRPQQDQPADCDCKWAFIVSGGVNGDSNHPRYWNDVVQKWTYKSEHADYPEACISTFYYTGTAKTDDVPDARVISATQENITSALADLAPEMQACKERGIKPTLQLLVTDHGTGYHDTNQGAGADHGGLGGKVDTDGDEGGDHDGIPERDLRIDATDLAPGSSWRFDLFPDDGQDPDTWVARKDGKITIWRCTGSCPPDAWDEVAQDADGDNIIDSSDGGIDLNGDGDTDDSASFDEGINLLDGEILSDDDLSDALTPLCASGADLYVEMAQCFGGGFRDDLARLREAGCHVHFAAAAGEGEYSWGTGGADGYDIFEKHFIDKITELITSTEGVTVTPDMWREAQEHAAEQPDSQDHNTHPVGDVDCLVMFGPYVKDGEVCIRVTNYCTESVETDVRLAAYDAWNIGLEPSDDYTDTVTLDVGESREWCRPLSDAMGFPCFLGSASIASPRQERHSRWLNDLEVIAPEIGAPVQRTFTVGGQLIGEGTLITYPVVLLEPIDRLPAGWDFTLDPPWIYEGLWVGDGPRPVTITIFPTSTNLGVGGVWVYGWGLGSISGVEPSAADGLPKDRYLGHVYLEVDTRPRVYLPLVTKGP